MLDRTLKPLNLIGGMACHLPESPESTQHMSSFLRQMQFLIAII